jgi:hypothetical protein
MSVLRNPRIASSPSLVSMSKESMMRAIDVDVMSADEPCLQSEYSNSTKRILALAHQAESCGSRTLENLSNQREQLIGIRQKINNINENVKISNGLIASMQSWFFSSWYKSKLVPVPALPLTLDDSKQHRTSPVTDHSDDTLTEISNVISRLKEQALAINRELDDSNSLLAEINPKCDAISNNLSIVSKATSRV